MSEFRMAVWLGLMLGMFLGGAWSMLCVYSLARWARSRDSIRTLFAAMMPARLALGAAVLVVLLLTLGCGSVAQLQLGTVKSHPSERTLRDHVCANNLEAARFYLALPEYQWLGAGTLESYRMDAMEHKRLGKCKCPQNAPCAVPSPSDGFVELPKREN